MTDAEVWLEIAEHMRGSGVLPGECYDDDELDAPEGLCDCLYDANICDVIDYEQYSRMVEQLCARYGRKKRVAGYFWRAGAIAPRIRACEQLAKEAACER